MDFTPTARYIRNLFERDQASKNDSQYLPNKLPTNGVSLHHEHEFDLGDMSYSKAMIAGSTAGVTEHIFMYPVDTIKTRMQAAVKPGVPVYSSVVDAVQTIVRTEGVARLYRGIPAILMAAIPSHAVYFATYEYTKELFGANQSGHTPLRTAAAGSCATMAHDAIVTPLDVVKQRLQVFNSRYTGIQHCIKDILKQEGFAAFYISYPTTVAMNIPFMSVHFAAYESFKIFFSDEHGHHGPIAEMTAGGLAGAAGGLVSTPFDVIKTRIQTKDTKSNVGFVQVTKQIMAEEGLVGFTRGMQARVLYFIPSAAICWTTYETMKKVLKAF
jgi:solute carrier family 25 iron transporter 28/37